MAKKYYKKTNKTTNNAGASTVALGVLLIAICVKLIIKLILIIFDAITIHTSGYKVKSQNGFFKTYFNKGNYGEFKLYKQAVRIFGKRNVLTNLYLENKNTEFTEIDVLAVTNQGIYVFEMKNYSGYIYGSNNDEYWTQVFHKNSKHKFYNPLKQNYAHTKAVETYLNIDSSKINPLIVFGNYAKLSKINVNEENVILHLKDLKKHIRKQNKIELLSNSEVIDYLDKLIIKSKMPDEVKNRHIEEVKLLQENKI